MNEAMMRKRVCSLVGHKDTINCVVFSPDGKTLASASDDGMALVWNTKTGKCCSVFCGDRFILSVAFAPLSGCNPMLAIGTTAGKALLLDAKGVTIHSYHSSDAWIWSVTFSPDGKTLASASDDGKVWVWNLQTHKCVNELDHNYGVRSMAFSSDGKLLASASRDPYVHLWNAETGVEECRLLGHEESVRCVAFSANGEFLASGSFDKTVRLWSLESHNCVGVLKGHKSAVSSVAFSRDGKTLASGSWDEIVRIWNTKSRECIEELTINSPINSVAFSFNGKSLAFGSNDIVLRIYSLLDYHVLGCASLYLQANVAPYVVLDVVDLLASHKKQRFSTTALHMHGEKISFIGDLLRKRVKR